MPVLPPSLEGSGIHSLDRWGWGSLTRPGLGEAVWRGQSNGEDGAEDHLLVANLGPLDPHGGPRSSQSL
jgi:hypothetical protein